MSQELGNSIGDSANKTMNGASGAVDSGIAIGKGAGRGIKGVKRLRKNAGKAAKAAKGVAEAVVAPEAFLAKVMIILAIILLVIILYIVVYGTTGPGMARTEYLTANNEEIMNEPESEEEVEESIEDKEAAVEETAALIQIIHDAKNEEKYKKIEEIRRYAATLGCDPDLTEQHIIDESATELIAGISASSIQEEQVQLKVWKFFKANGYSDAATAGIMGNMKAESGFNPGVEEKTARRDKGYGLCQWTFGRRTNLENFARKKGKKASDIDVQLDFLMHEIKHSYKRFYKSSFRNSTSLASTTYDFLAHFEVPANIPGTYPVRLGYAKEIYNKYKGIDADGAQTESNKTTVTPSSVKVNLTTKAVRTNICNWAKKIAADDSYKYYKMEVNKTCPICHPGKGKKGWQCIGFVSAAYHHNGVKSVKCAMDGLGNNSSLTKDTIGSWRKRNGKDWDRIENPKMSQLVAGDVLICFKGSKYQHTALYVGNGMICDAANERAGIKYRKYSSLGSKVKYAYRYNGTAIGEATGSDAGTVSGATAIVRKCQEICWPEGTPQSKWKFSTGGPTSKYKSAFEKYAPWSATRVHMSDCGNFVVTIARAAGVDPKCKSFNLTYTTKSKEPKFELVHSGPMSSFKPQAGDIIYYKKSTISKATGKPSQHVLIYLGNNRIAESGYKSRFCIIRNLKTPKWSKSNVKKDTIRVYRAVGSGTLDDEDVASSASRSDFDMLAAYSVSVGNGELELKDKEASMNIAEDDGELDESTYTDITGKPIPLYWFGEKRGMPNYKKDLKKKLSKTKGSFFDVSYETTSDGKLSFGYETIDGIEYKYITPTIKEKDVIEEGDEGESPLCESLFDVNPDELYGEAEPAGSDDEDGDDSQTPGIMDVTNAEAIKGISEQSYQLLGNGMEGASDILIVGNGTMADPLGGKGKVTSSFGYRSAASTGGIGSTSHKGMDIAAPTGTNVYAAAAGTITTASVYGGYGNCIIIDHGGGIKTIYGHLSKILVKKGGHVEMGQLIGKVGSTGNSTGPHLHFELQKNGKAVNPASAIGR